MPAHKTHAGRSCTWNCTNCGLSTQTIRSPSTPRTVTNVSRNNALISRGNINIIVTSFKTSAGVLETVPARIQFTGKGKSPSDPPNHRLLLSANSMVPLIKSIVNRRRCSRIKTLCNVYRSLVNCSAPTSMLFSELMVCPVLVLVMLQFALFIALGVNPGVSNLSTYFAGTTANGSITFYIYRTCTCL